MPPLGAEFPTRWKMHRRALHAIFIHRRGFSTFHRECVASQRVAGPIDRVPPFMHSFTFTGSQLSSSMAVSHSSMYVLAVTGGQM